MCTQINSLPGFSSPQTRRTISSAVIPLPPPAHEQLDDLIFAVAQVHAAGGCPKLKCLR